MRPPGLVTTVLPQNALNECEPEAKQEFSASAKPGAPSAPGHVKGEIMSDELEKEQEVVETQEDKGEGRQG